MTPEDLVPVQPDADPILALRRTVAHARELQRVGISGFAIEAANHEALNNPLNQRLLDGFMTAIPVEFPDGTESDLITAQNPHDVIPAISWYIRYMRKAGVGYARAYDRPTASLVIGERADPANDSKVNLLLAFVNEEGSTVVAPGLVPAEQWHAKRDALIERMRGAQSEDELKHLFIPKLGQFQVPRDRLLTLTSRYDNAAHDFFDAHKLRLSQNSAMRNFKKPGKSNPLAIGFLPSIERAIRVEDFTDYNIMYNLEMLAAAFGVEAELDQLKDERNGKKTTSPEEKLTEIPDLQSVLERSLPRRIASFIVRHHLLKI